jgi:RNA polymerase sigma-70 factor (ECF subfamily)
MLVSGEKYLKNQLVPAVAENDMTDDKRLVERFNQGDKSAFDRIVEKYSEDVAALANRLLGWTDNVDDIVQEVFLSAYLALKDFRQDSSLKTWLFKIAVNQCHTHRRKRMTRTRTLAGKSENAPLESGESSDKPLMDLETFEQVQRAVKGLPLKYRRPVVLRYLQELSMAEICSILDIKESTLHVRLSRARTMLKQDLESLIE